MLVASSWRWSWRKWRVHTLPLFSFSCHCVQIPAAQVACIDDPRLPDGMREHWQAEVVAEHVAAAVARAAPGVVSSSR